VLNAINRWLGRNVDGPEVVTSYRVAEQDPALGVPGADLSRLAFIHHTTSIFNIGDYLSSPRHYFRFEPTEGGRPVAVIGGGVFGNYGIVRKKVTGIDLEARCKVGWGIGLSVKGRESDRRKMDAFSAALDVNATRDPELSSDSVQFCPCSSVFNSLTELPPGQEVGILLNHSPQVSGRNPLALHARHHNLVMGGNALSENDFRALFARIGHLVTNSYHTAMWGLLSGRSVGIIGFSSKYTNILKMFGMPGEYLHVQKGDYDGLSHAIDRILAKGRFVSAPDAAERRDEFRRINLAYAQQLVDRGLFKRIDLVPDDQRSLERRNAEVFRTHVLASAFS
jgi:hypothetical protein